MKKILGLTLFSLLALSSTACQEELAYGDPNAVIVAAPVDAWPELEDSVFAVLAPDVYTLRDERTFRLRYENPAGPDWGLKRKFREEVLIGSRNDNFIQEALQTLDSGAEVQAPGVYQTEDVWAKNQHVVILLVDPSGRDPPGPPSSEKSIRSSTSASDKAPETGCSSAVQMRPWPTPSRIWPDSVSSCPRSTDGDRRIPFTSSEMTIPIPRSSYGSSR